MIAAPNRKAHSAMVIMAAASALIAPQAALATPGLEQSATGVATAEIVAPLTVRAIADLDFGGIALRSSESGSVVLDPDSGSASYSGVDQISCNGSPCAPQLAEFAVKGMAGRNYRVVLPDAAQANPVEGSGSALQVNELNSASLNLPGTRNRGLLDAKGNDLLKVGGKLQVPAGTAPGHYVARLDLVVSYD